MRLIAPIVLALAALASMARAAPAPPPPAMAAVVGEYGAGQARLFVFERAGGLYAQSEGQPVRLQAIDGGFSGGGVQVSPAGAKVGDTLLPPRDVDRETVARIQAGVKADPAGARAAALAATPPVEPPPARTSDLVDITTIAPTIRLDIRYAGANNFMGFALYERPAAFLQRPAAEALGRVAARLRAEGYGLLVHDGYRPWFVTRMFWDATPDYAHMFVADPAQGSRHNRGCAVDLTLYDLKTGEPVEMTGRYDEMSPRSYADYPGGTSRQRWLRDLLRAAMEAEGFAVLPEEWWHFDYRDWRDYGIGTATFDQLLARPR